MSGTGYTLLTELEAAKYLRVSRSFMAQRRMDSLSGSKHGPHYYRLGGSGGSIRYDIADLDAWIAECKGNKAEDMAEDEQGKRHV